MADNPLPRWGSLCRDACRVAGGVWAIGLLLTLAWRGASWIAGTGFFAMLAFGLAWLAAEATEGFRTPRGVPRRRSR